MIYDIINPVFGSVAVSIIKVHRKHLKTNLTEIGVFLQYCDKIQSKNLIAGKSNIKLCSSLKVNILKYFLKLICWRSNKYE